MSCALNHKFREHRTLPILFCELCGAVVEINGGWKSASASLPISSPTLFDPTSSSTIDTTTTDNDPRTPEEIESHVTQLLRASGLHPDDPLLRRQAREVITDDLNEMEDASLFDDEDSPDDPVDIDGKRYYERRVPVVDDDALPAAGL